MSGDASSRSITRKIGEIRYQPTGNTIITAAAMIIFAATLTEDIIP